MLSILLLIAVSVTATAENGKAWGERCLHKLSAHPKQKRSSVYAWMEEIERDTAKPSIPRSDGAPAQRMGVYFGHLVQRASRWRTVQFAWRRADTRC